MTMAEFMTGSSWTPQPPRSPVKLRGPAAMAAILVLHLVLVMALLVSGRVTKQAREPLSIAVLNLTKPAKPPEIAKPVPVKLPNDTVRLNLPVPPLPELPPVHSETEITQPVPTQPQLLKTIAPPAPPIPETNAPVSDSFEAQLLGHLERYKRYPQQARARGDKGISFVRFTLERDGSVGAVELVTSSGSRLLDQEAVALITRAEPLPKIPDDRHLSSMVIIVPIKFFL